MLLIRSFTFCAVSILESLQYVTGVYLNPTTPGIFPLKI
jgi:hypothetical protein